MAKTKKTTEATATIVTDEQPTETTSGENQAVVIDVPEEVIKETVVAEEIPDEAFEVKEETLPTQIMFEGPIQELVAEQPVSVSPHKSEIDFLKRVLQIQHEGGFGRHLDSIINERIKSLS